MRPVFVVELGVSIHDVIEMRPAEAHKVAQALPLNRTDPALDERVGIRSHDRRFDGLDPPGNNQQVKAFCELRVAVVQAEAGLQPVILQPHHEVAALLFDPGFIGVVRRQRDPDLPCSQVQEYPKAPETSPLSIGNGPSGRPAFLANRANSWALISSDRTIFRASGSTSPSTSGGRATTSCMTA